MNVLCRMKAGPASSTRSARTSRVSRARWGRPTGPASRARRPAPMLDRSASIHGGPFRAALRGLWVHGARVHDARTEVPFDGRGDHDVPDGTGQRRLGGGLRSARLVVDAVVVAGEAVDEEPLEDGGVEARPRRGREFVQPAAAIFSRRSCLACFGLLASCPAQSGLQCRTHFADRASPRLRSGGSVRCGCVAVLRTEPRTRQESTNITKNNPWIHWGFCQHALRTPTISPYTGSSVAKSRSETAVPRSRSGRAVCADELTS